ncbi:ubiquitin-conjugating enzyme e2 25-like [Plakobranchus ocellatus]|uniref:Ubiquitin-conjugating enzyme e2 25-like n=1 Tax=Plakobranchus ocellatus TaxID=259542 RepID=A0AAV4DY71_9GAST|nr:ubiquitin-conjugating enzyme e2 25-like [Plakobranchus ocellatus]
MDISLIKKEATDYLQSSKSDLQVSDADENLRQIQLTSKTNNFTCIISCPASDKESWGIWSDIPSCFATVHLVWEKCSLDSSCSIKNLLQAVSEALAANSTESNKVSMCDDGSDSGEESSTDEDDDFDMELYADRDIDMEQELKQLKEYDYLRALEKSETKTGIDARPFENDLFVWRVKLTDIPLETKLGQDLLHYSQKYEEEPVVHLEMQFPPNYPFAPPFIRVLKPRFKFLTGHVTVGGSICMQMLTNSGWQPTNDIESILIQVRAEILGDQNASLADYDTNKTYSFDEAKVAFQRMVKKYKW